ncbi:hypothetical protein AGLY_014365 [Aphis glycines]|uniref:Uncharacterized protein n=1 Tax=Aphis glycines TaxID=307491 RepID=A0A6G0T5Y0_APHGL|nr:hypothetical protein AGLY_014365 [Aphis glycines]
MLTNVRTFFIVIDFTLKSTGNIFLPRYFQYELDLIIYQKSPLKLKSIFSTKKNTIIKLKNTDCCKINRYLHYSLKIQKYTYLKIVNYLRKSSLYQLKQEYRTICNFGNKLFNSKLRKDNQINNYNMSFSNAVKSLKPSTYSYNMKLIRTCGQQAEPTVAPQNIIDLREAERRACKKLQNKNQLINCVLISKTKF